jgi:hypothetical protein
VILATRVRGRALVEHHRNVRPEVLLHPRRQLRSEEVGRAVVDRGELNPLFEDLPLVGEREDLVAPRIGEHRPIPTREAVQPTSLPDQVRSGAEVQVVGIPEHDTGPR